MVVAAGARPPLTGANVYPTQLVDYGPALGVDCLDGHRPVGRHAYEERSVGGQGRGSQFDSFDPDVAVLMVCRAQSERLALEDPNRLDSPPIAVDLLGVEYSLAEQVAALAVPPGGLGADRRRQRRRLRSGAEVGDRMQSAQAGVQQLDDLAGVRIEDTQCAASGAAQEPSVGQRRDVEQRRVAGHPLLRYSLAQRHGGDHRSVGRQAGEASVGQRGRRAKTEVAQPRVVVFGSRRRIIGDLAAVGTDQRLAAGAVGTHSVDSRLDLRTFQEIVVTDKRDPAVGHHRRLAVGHDMVGQRMNLRAVGAEAEKAPRGVAVVLVAAAGSAGSEDDPPVGQHRRIEVLPRTGRQSLEARAVGADAKQLEELLALGHHGEDDFLAVVGAGGRGDQPPAGIDQQPRRGLGHRRCQCIEPAAGGRGRRRVVLERRLAPVHFPLRSLCAGRVHRSPASGEHHAGRPAEIGARIGEAAGLGRWGAAGKAAVDHQPLWVGESIGNGQVAPRAAAHPGQHDGRLPGAVVVIGLGPVSAGFNGAQPVLAGGKREFLAVGRLDVNRRHQTRGPAQAFTFDGDHVGSFDQMCFDTKALDALPILRGMAQLGGDAVIVHVQLVAVVGGQYDGGLDGLCR